MSRASVATTAARWSSSSVLQTGMAPLSFLSSQKLSCVCTAVLLRWRSLAIRCRESPQESIDDRARVKQLAEVTGSPSRNATTGHALLRYALGGLFLRVKIGPARWYERACAIRQDQHQV